jgi:hypothetical protein
LPGARQAPLFEDHLKHAQQVQIDFMEISHAYGDRKID